MDHESWHGTSGGYCNHGCRCDACRDAHRLAHKRHRTNRYAERVEVGDQLVHLSAPHGTVRAYDYFGCRCDDCRSTHARRRRAQRRAS